MAEMTVGLGGAPAVVTTSGRSSGAAAGELASEINTVGAPFRCVTPSAWIRPQISSGSTPRSATWVPPSAVTAHVVHQPLQWNIGSVQRYTLSGL